MDPEGIKWIYSNPLRRKWNQIGIKSENIIKLAT
jgi:hypothetical protein